MNPSNLNIYFNTGRGYRLPDKHVLLGSLLMCLILWSAKLEAVSRVSVNSGNFSNPSTWNPSGIPTLNDEIIIQNNHIVNVDNNSVTGKITVSNGGKLIFTPGKKISIHGDFIVYGTAEIIEGDVDLINGGSAFNIGATGNVVWQPANNSASGATLFTNGVEYFHPASTLVINRWYNYSNVPLGSVVTGNFGNVTLNTLTNGLLYEWNQDNAFETHVILGTLTIDQAWIVLDKSGLISNTTIGAIHLNNVNSYLDIHSGHHQSSFTVTIGSFSNIGGTFNGIYNGNGNITLQVNGNFTNLGNTVLIYNSGIQGIANGNATMKVTGTCIQSTGDFRGIFNLSSSNSGKVDLEFDDVNLTGGIFMGHYACHTGGNISNIKIKGDLLIDFSTSTAKFRGNGLTTLSGTNNNLQLQLIIEGELIVKGTTNAEFTSSGSTGSETTTIKGNTSFEGCTSNFNYGSHSTTLTFYEDVVVSGGIVYFSRTSGSLTALLQKNLVIQYGNTIVTGGTGNSNLIVNGDYYQTGGSLFLHNNNSSPSTNIVYVTVNGDFLNQSGNISFDNNTGSTVQHRISLNGPQFVIGGSATINTSVSNASPMYGIIYFDYTGEMEYHQTGPSVLMRYVKQVINNDCILKVSSGDMQAAEAVTAENDMISVQNGGILDLQENQIYANRLSIHSSLNIADNGRLRISSEEGLYNGTATAAIKSAGNMTYLLHPNSTVEYYGDKEQIITGTGTGTADSQGQQYGNLEINKSGSKAILNNNKTVVRGTLHLEQGELDLNNYNITLNSGIPTALTSITGYVKSEGAPDGTTGMVKWKNISPGLHAIPFGTSRKHLLPFLFTPISGFGNEFAIATRSCQPDNRPLTNGVTNLKYHGKEAGIEKVIDRWFHINATGIRANISATYLASENTTTSELATKNFSLMAWTNSEWRLLGGYGEGNVENPGMVTSDNINTWGSLLLVSNEKLEAADLLSFDAKLNNSKVDISWVSMANISPVKYTIERSDDEYQFSDLMEKPANPQSGSPINYTAVDDQPLPGASWYRLKQHQPDGVIKYSQPVKIENSKLQSNAIEVLSAGPNPFDNQFTLWYQVPVAATIEIKLTGSNGQVVHNIFFQNEAGRNSYLFHENEKLSPGIYILTISNGKSSKSIKLFHI